MKKTITLILCLLFASISSFATIVPAGTITTNTTWTKAGSPYVITGEVVFDINTTLSIDPGVIVRFDSNCTIAVKGKLKMEGTATDSIIIISNKPGITIADAYQGTTYYGFSFRESNPADTSYIAYCSFSMGSCGIWAGTNASHINVSNSTFSDCMWGINISGGNIHVDNCHFNRCRYAINSFTGSYRVTNSSFAGGNYGIWVDNWNIDNYCANSVFLDNGVAIVRCTYVLNNIIIGSKVYGVETCTFVFNNQIWFNNIGIERSVDSAAHNSIAYNKIGVDYQYNTGPFPSFKYNCIAHNTDHDFFVNGPDLDVSDNYWGTTDSATIAAGVYDFYDVSTMGKLIFTPFLTTPNGACDTLLPTGINNTNQKSSVVSVFPNPASSSLTIDAGTRALQEVFIYNMTGRLVYHIMTGKSKLEVNVFSFPGGIYMYKLRLNDESLITGKITKE